MEDKMEIAVLQIRYQNKFKNKDKLFPREWYNIIDYNLKKKILNECIAKNILIVECSNYYAFKSLALNTFR